MRLTAISASGLVTVAALAALGILVAGLRLGDDGSGARLVVPNGARPTATRPNILLIVTDDQRADTLWAMPTVQRKLGRRGIVFRNGFVVNSLCCPSRATILTGRHSHSTGVYTNAAPHGGFDAFNDRSTVATWLQDAGYRTALIGKYFNGYDDAQYVPPGWDEWHAFTSHPGSGGAFIRYELSANGSAERYGAKPTDYSTDVLAEKAESFIRTSQSRFFLYLAPFAPHGGRPAPRHNGEFENVEIDRRPSYNEADVGDKPAWVRRLPLIAKNTSHRGALEALIAVDEAIAGMLAILSEQGELRDTLVVFTSDNGRAWGEHRWVDKADPYRGSMEIPFVVRYDRLISQARRDRHLVLNLDLAPTLADLAEAGSPGAEGRSLVPLLRSPQQRWRRDFLIEHLEWRRKIPSYCGIRSRHYLYVAYDTGEEELYDLKGDPFELDNLAADPAVAAVKEQHRKRVRALCSPPPPGYSFPFSDESD